VKTGTSQAYHDNWVVGYTRDVTVGVWVGNFDRTPLVGSSGVSGAGPIFQAAMLAAVEHAGRGVDDISPILEPPGELARVEICLVSGMAAGDACMRRGLEWTSGASRDECTWHRREGAEIITEWPDEYRRWAASEGLDAPAVSRVAQRTSAPRGGFRITTPQRDAVYLIDPTLRAEFQALAIAADGGSGRVRWTIDGRDAGTTPVAGTLDWPLTPGRHTIVATDGSGRTARTSFLVK
jgi:penicillin-binding protein 1C